MDRTIDTNIRNIRDHYNQYFDLLDREKTLSAAGWNQPPPIMNIGYWGRGATTSREAQIQFVHELALRAPSLKDIRVLDVGCGLTGPASILAREYGAEVDGLNIVEQQVVWARKYVAGNGLQDRVRVHLASAMDIPFPDESVDVVFSLEAAHCFIDKPRFLAEARRVLRPDGKLLLADITATSHVPFLRWQPALKLNLVTAADWRRMIEAGGFALEQEELIGHSVYPGFRRWADRTAGERRRTILSRICKNDASLPVRSLKQLQAWALEYVRCRSVLKIGSWLKLRQYVLFVASKAG